MIRMMKIPLQVLKQPRLTEPPEPPEPALPPRLPRSPRLPRLLRLAPPLGGTLIRSSGAEFGAPVDSVDPCRRTELHVDPTDPMDSMAALARRCHAARTMVASTRDRKDRKDRKAVASGTRTRFGVSGGPGVEEILSSLSAIQRRLDKEIEKQQNFEAAADYFAAVVARLRADVDLLIITGAAGCGPPPGL